MEPFVVSALKYRPETFADVVGQESITTTLENAIQNNHLAQALLFCGPRGVGKTTCARILAKKINQDGTEAPDEDFAFNIFELDAASNNSVDDIRAVIDQVRIPPQVGKFKVYIIDEVHMLSQAAFNAFLKTLEEPPAHVIFILATTEKHKIIPTILSRCQIFDFKRIGIEDAKNYLKKIAHKENIKVDDDALHLIAQKADGAMRDALSIFDRIVSFSGTEVNVEAVSTNLNILDYDTYFEMTTYLIQQQIPEAILLFDKILQKGIDGHHFVTGLATHFRDLWVAKNPETLILLEVGENAQKTYASQSKTTDSSFLTKAIEIANQCDLQYKISKNQRLLVELTLMQLASINDGAEKKKPNPYIISASDVKLPPKAKEQKLVDAEVIEIETVIESPTIETKVEEQKPTYTPPKQMTEGVSGLSLSSLKLKKIVAQQQKQAEGVLENLPENEINADALLKTWQDFSSKLKNEGAHNLATLMQLDTPKLKNETEIHLTFPNQTNKVEFHRASEPLLKFLKNSLQNHKISIEIEINEVVEKQYIYTPMEKYEKLRSINPYIETLRKEFKLDL